MFNIENDSVLESVFREIKSRAKNPFIGSFVISWILFNWDLLFYLAFSNDIAEDKISNVFNKMLTVGDSFWFPLMTSVAYTVAFPWINLLFEKLTKSASTLRIINRLDSDDDLNDKIEEISRLEGIVRSNMEKSDQITDLEGKIQLAEQQREELRKKMGSKIDVLQSEKSELQSSNNELLKKIDELGNNKGSQTFKSHFENDIPIDIIQIDIPEGIKNAPTDKNHLIGEINSYLSSKNLNYRSRLKGDLYEIFVSNLSAYNIADINNIAGKYLKLDYHRRLLGFEELNL